MQQELSEVYFYLKGTLKYRRIAIMLALFVCLCAWIYVFWMPNKFESKAKVHIDSATVIRPLMRGMVIDPDISALIRIIQQLMFTRPNLEKIVELSLLNQEKSSNGISNETIEALKKEITIKSAGDRDIFDIAYTSYDPEVAKSVVQAVLTVFSEQTQGKAMADANDAQSFIEQQIRDYEIRLQEAEKSKEEFKRANMDLLNGDSDQFHLLQNLKEELQKATLALEQLQAKKNVLAVQLQEVQESNEEWAVTNLTHESSAEDVRIQKLKDRKTDLLLKYTDQHPEIKGIDKLVETLTTQRDMNKNQNVDNEIIDNQFLGADKLSNPYVQTLKSAYDSIGAEVAAVQALSDSITGRISKLENGLKDRLTIETEMKNLNRDYETISKQYSSLLDRREQAHITERVDDQTSRLKFKIADPPSKPLKPTFPNRILFYTIILVIGVAIGFGVAFLIYFIRPVYMSARQVRAVTGLPTLGSVSLTNLGQSKSGGKDWVFISTIVVLMAGYLSVMTIELLK